MDLSFVTRKLQRSMAGLSLLAILASFAGFTGTAFAKTFTDVPTSSFAYDHIDALSDAGIMTGEGDGVLFNPKGELTREEAAKIFVEAFVGSVDTSYDAGFSDITPGQWYTDYVNTAALYGIFSGNPDGSFGLGEFINRADFAKVAVSAAGLENAGMMGSDKFNDVPAGSYYDAYVGTAWENSILDGTSATTYSPAMDVTREQAAKMTYNAMNPVFRGEATDDGDTDTDTDTDEGSADATVTVEVSDDTPVADTIPSNATSVELASFDFTAEGDDSLLESLTVHQYGISSTTQMTVYLYNGSERLTSGTSISSTDNASDLRNIDVELPEDETVTLTIRADMGDWTSTGEVGFEIESADMVDVGESSVEGDFPVMGEKFSVATTDVGTLTVEKNGSVTDAQVGEDDSTVAKFKLTADSTEGGYVKEVGLYVSGAINTADVENFRLYVTGDDAEPIAQAANVDDLDVARLVVGEGEGVMEGMEDGYHLEKGATKSFYVIADLNTGRTDDTLKVYIDLDTDMLVMGDKYDFGMSVNRKGYDGGTDSSTESNGTCTATTSDCAYMTLEGGDITVSSNGPAANDIAINGKDQTLLNFVVATVSDVTFDNFPLQLVASESSDTTEGLLNSTTANFTDIKVVDTDSGEQMYSSVDATSLLQTSVTGSVIAEGSDSTTSNGFYLWTDDWEAEAGAEYNLSVQTDVANTSTLDNMTIYAILPLSTTYPGLKDTNNKTLTNSSVLVPTSSIVGKTMTVKAPALTVSLASAVTGNNTYVKGSQDVEFVAYSFACGNSSDCRVTDLTLQGYLDDDGSAAPTLTSSTSQTNSSALTSYVGSVWLVDGNGDVISDAEAISTSAFTVVFDNIDWTVDAGQTELVYVVGDLSSNSYANSDAESIAFGLTSTSNLTVEDEDGNSFTPSGTPNATTPTVYVTTSAGGSLTVAVTNTANEDIVVAGTSDVEVSKFKFTSTAESFTVTDLAINNRQSAVTSSTTLGDYDNNVSSVTIEYENSDGETETSTGYLTSGTANFSGLDFFVEKDDTAEITVYADLNDIQSSGSSSTAGEFVDFNLAFNNFEALAGGSGETYKVNKLDGDVGASSDLDFGTITWTDSGYDTNNASGQTVTGGSSQTITIDTGTTVFPVGTLLFVDDTADASYTESSESLFVTTAAWSTTTPTVFVANDDDASLADNKNVYYALPGTGYLTGAHQMVVYKSKPTVALSSSSKSGLYTPANNDEAFAFTISADDNEDIQIRAGEAGDDENDVVETGMDDADVAQTSAAGEVVDGSSAIEVIFDANSIDDNDCLMLDESYTAGTMDDYAYVSFFLNINNAASTVPSYDALELVFDDDTICTSGGDQQIDFSTSNTWINGVQLSSTANVIGGNNTTSGTNDRWELVTVAVSPTTARTAFGFNVSATDGTNDFAASDFLRIDGVVFHNEMLVVDMAADPDFNNDETSGLTAYLKKDGTVVAQGGVGFMSTSGAKVMFVPGGLNPSDTYSNITITAGETSTFKVMLNTDTLLDQDDGSDDPLLFSIDAGSSVDGTVTAGDFWWSADETTPTIVRWLGDVTNSTISNSGLKY